MNLSRQNPTAFLFMLDQSGSMSDEFGDATKADRLASIFNRLLANLVIRCSKNDGVRDYVYVGVLGYGANGVVNLLAKINDDGDDEILRPISWVAENPLRVEERLKKEDDGAGGILERKIRFPVWVEEAANGGTPMCQAFYEAGQAIAAFCNEYPTSYPPTILNITDGEANDGDPEELAKVLMKLHTEDGEVVVLNLHLGDSGKSELYFPSRLDALNDKLAKKMFNCSSFLPGLLLEEARRRNYAVDKESRGIMFNVDNPVAVIDFLEIGTRVANR